MLDSVFNMGPSMFYSFLNLHVYYNINGSSLVENKEIVKQEIYVNGHLFYSHLLTAS